MEPPANSTWLTSEMFLATGVIIIGAIAMYTTLTLAYRRELTPLGWCDYMFAGGLLACYFGARVTTSNDWVLSAAFWMTTMVFVVNLACLSWTTYTNNRTHNDNIARNTSSFDMTSTEPNSYASSVDESIASSSNSDHPPKMPDRLKELRARVEVAESKIWLMKKEFDTAEKDCDYAMWSVRQAARIGLPQYSRSSLKYLRYQSENRTAKLRKAEHDLQTAESECRELRTVLETEEEKHKVEIEEEKHKVETEEERHKMETEEEEHKDEEGGGSGEKCAPQ